MPASPPRPCRWPGCPGITRDRSGYCPEHKPQVEEQRAAAQKGYERERGSASERGYDARWRKARVSYLRRHPLCVTCQSEGRLVPATVVDHITPHKGDQDLFWDENNWQSLCESCHDRKTAKEGGWGRGGANL